MASENKYRSNYHYRIIKSGRKELFSEIVKWGEAGWWPRGAMMKFTRLTDGEVRKGTRYIQKVRLAFGPCWNSEVSDIKDNESITRSFSGDLFEGSETVSIKPLCCHNLKAEYEMFYRVKGWGNKLLWNLILRRFHDKNIEMILETLKVYMETTEAWKH